MGKKSGPPAPDYKGTAEAQSESSAYNTSLQNWANRPTLTTPWGSQSWTSSQQIDPATGKPVTSWASNIQLSPDQQAALDDQMKIQSGRSDAALGLLNQATDAFNSPFQWGSPVRSQLDYDPSKFRQEAQDAVWKLQQPMLDENQKKMEASLLNQGISLGSEAWDKRQREQDDAMARARLMSVEAGRGEADSMFSHALQSGQFENQAHQQAIADEMMRRNMPLNDLNALLTGQQVGMPQKPNFMGAGKGETTQYLPAAQMGYDASLDRYNAQAGFQSQLMNAGTSAAMAYFFSDARLKEGIVPLGILESGCPVVYYRYRGLPLGNVGVLAQDALHFCPEAVALDPSGFYVVDYSKVR